jgi:hypothetical protein
MKAMVLHDAHGNILSVAKIGDLKAAGSKFLQVGMVPGKGQHVAEIHLDHEHANRPLHELHAGYRVDAAARKLVKKHS